MNVIEWSLLSRARLKKVRGKPSGFIIFIFPSKPAFTDRVVLMPAIKDPHLGEFIEPPVKVQMR